MPNYHRLFQPGGTFFFTVVTYDRRRLFGSDRARQCLREVIRTVQKERPFEMLAIVLLPQHLHCVWRLPDEDCDFSRRWGCIKSGFTKLWLPRSSKQAGTSPSREKRHERTVWQRRFWEHRIRDEEDLIRHVNYVHYNPVKHGLVSCPHAWPYSSFLRWAQEGYYHKDWLCTCTKPTVTIPDWLRDGDTFGE